MVDQTVAFFNSLPQILKEARVTDTINLDTIVPELTSLPGSVIKIVVGAFSNLLAVFTVLVLTFYCILERENLNSYLKVLFEDQRKEETVYRIVQKIEKTIGSWVRGQLLLMFVVGFISYIGFRILGLPFAVALAVLAGLLELIPNIGPTIAAIPAILVGLSISPYFGD